MLIKMSETASQHNKKRLLVWNYGFSRIMFCLCYKCAPKMAAESSLKQFAQNEIDFEFLS